MRSSDQSIKVYLPIEDLVAALRGYLPFMPTEVQISPCTRVVEVEKCISSHAQYLRGNPNNFRYWPYYYRLCELYWYCLDHASDWQSKVV